jgi:hypothetical protein
MSQGADYLSYLESAYALIKQGNCLLTPLQSMINFFLFTCLYQINRGIAKG